MSSNRDHLFPATSIGRSQGSRFPTQRVTSGDSSAHPLLSSTSISSRPSSPALFESNDLPGGSPKYVPYTPRQRVSTTAVTTGTAHPPSPQHPPGQGDATSKLQLLQLKSAAQHVGLDTASVGWAMLEKLVHESDHNDADWIEIWTAVTTGKATLLLPLEHLSSSDKLTGDFVKDHVVLCDGPSRNNAPIVTLSGLRGTLNDQTLTFRSTLHPYSKIFQDLLSASTRSSALPLLPDLPNTTVSYPTFSVPSHAPSLPLPPRTHAQTAKPPLPPRPGGRSASNPSSSSRIANPFAALFGSGSSSATLNQPKTSPVPIPSSPTASLRSLDSHSEHNTVEVAAFTISKKIVRKDVAKEMTKALKKAVKESLSTAFGETNGSANGNGGPGNGGQLPSWVIERVQEFTANWYPFVKDRERKKGSSALPSVSSGYHVAWIGESPEKMAENVQDFYLGLEQDLRVLGFGNEKGRHLNEEYDPYGCENDEKRVQEKIVSETKIKEAMEVVERTICSLFYDRMYCQPMSDDSSHDEALSSRVAALNMLDLGLEHLDIHTEDAGPELDAVVHACGEMLSQIDTCRSPGDKAAILVAAHKVIVDGLSRLPPIRLMTEEESKAQKAKAAAIAKSNALADTPPKEADGSLKIHLPPNSPDTSAPPSTGGTNAKEIKSPSAVGPLAPSPVRPTIPTIVEPEAEAPKEEAPAEVEDVQEQGSVKAPSPVLSISPAPASTPVSGDVLLPMIIFSVVKANPPRLVSNLLFTQRYRNQSIGGEESYCLINLMAVAEFLENVDLAALGLSNSDKVLSAADLTPIPLDRSPLITDEPEVLPEGLPNSFRERVEQANKVITGVVDTSVGMLRSLLPVVPGPANQGPTIPAPMEEAAQSTQPRNSVKPGFGMLRRESGGFSMRSIRSMASNLPGAGRGRGGTGADEERGQQMVSVPRPGSVKSRASVIGEEEEEEVSTDEDDGDDESSVSGSVGEGEEGEELGVGNEGAGVDARSIRSFESMMSASAKAKGKPIGERKSLSDRLAHMSSLAGRKQGSGATSGRTSLQPQAGTTSGLPDSPTNSSRPQSPAPPPTAVPTMSAPPLLRVAPPIPRFVECSAGDLRLSEVSELLRDYRRLVVAIKSVGGFEE